MCWGSFLDHVGVCWMGFDLSKCLIGKIDPNKGCEVSLKIGIEEGGERVLVDR